MVNQVFAPANSCGLLIVQPFPFAGTRGEVEQDGGIAFAVFSLAQCLGVNFTASVIPLDGMAERGEISVCAHTILADAAC